MKGQFAVVWVWVLGAVMLVLGMALPGCVFPELLGQVVNPEDPVPVSQEEGEESQEEVEEPRPEVVVVPPEVTLSSSRPVRGEHVVLEVGPVLKGRKFRVESPDLRGDLSLPFWLENRLHYVLSVSYFNEPGEYTLIFEALDEEGPGEAWERHVTLEVVEGDYTHQRFSVSSSTTQGWTSSQLAIDRERTRQARETTVNIPLWQGHFQWPLEGRISSDYGALRTINNRTPTRHNGIDIAAREGTPLAAGNAGIVRLAEHQLASGNIIVIDHGLDLSSAYLHLHEIWVEVGQKVEKGELIGTVGKTGYATGPHLHWSVFVGHTPVSPYCLMEEGHPSSHLVWDRALGPH